MKKKPEDFDRKKPEITREKLGNNLFLSNLKIPVNKMVLPGRFTVDKDGDILPAEQEFERDTYSRVYNDADRRLKMSKLSPRATDLLMWVIYEADIGLDYIWINRLRYMKEKRVRAYNTYKEALNELCRNEFLAITTIQSVYWINPYFFFNGSRSNAFPNNVIRK